MINIILPIIVYTANILGILTDPFEFAGDYGTEVNPIRQKVFEQVVSKEALARNLSDSEVREQMADNQASKQAVDDYRNFLIQKAIQEEKEYGPTLAELVSTALIDEMRKKQGDLKDVGFTESDFEAILSFIEHYKEQKIFRLLRNNPPILLSLDKALRDQAAREGKIFNLPILGSTKPLEGNCSFALKKNLIHAVFTEEAFHLTKSSESIKHSLNKLSKDYLKELLGKSADNKELEVFSSPLGQLFFYWMYQALNLELVSSDLRMIAQINQVKEMFTTTLGDPSLRARAFKDKLIAIDAEILFTQESDALVPQTLTEDGLFLPVNGQNVQDGTLIFLRSDQWEPNYEIIPFDEYEGFKAGRLNVILATKKESGQKFLLASCHGNSTKAEDGRLQIQLIKEKFDQLSDGHLQLLIGIDANTKTEEDVQLFKQQLELLGLTSTQTGPTTIKKRMVSAQHSKVGKFASDEEDYLVTLQPKHGGQWQLSQVTVGFLEEKAALNQPLPNIHNLSDHYPVGAVMIPVNN